MIKYGFNVWLNDSGEVELGQDAFEEIMTFIAGIGVPTWMEFKDVEPSFLYERVLNFYKGHFNYQRINKNKFKEWIEFHLPEDEQRDLNTLNNNEWLDCIVNIYLDICNVEFPEDSADKLEEKMN